MENVTFQTIKGISFGVYTNEEIKKLSVLEVTNTEILDVLGHPSPAGLYDLRLGPNEKDDVCETCGLNFFKCPGHPGHITLPVPVYNPVFYPHLYQLLRGSCLQCHRLLAPPVQLYLALYQLQALDYGLVSTVQELAEAVTDTGDESIMGMDPVIAVQIKLKKKYDEAVQGLVLENVKDPVKSVVECRRRIVKNFIKNNMMGVTGKCPHCKMPKKKITRHNMRIVYVETHSSNINVRPSDGTSQPEIESLSSTSTNKEILPEEARKHLHLLWENDKIFLQNLFKTLYLEKPHKELSINMFFMDLIIVPPSKFRRLNIMKGRKYADSQTVQLNDVLKDCQLIRNLLRLTKKMPIDQAEKDVISKLPGKSYGEKFNLLYQTLQRHVNEIFDTDSIKDRNKVAKGIKQILEKKEGLFRMNMMGKRVNFAARSVISPDPYIHVNEIGIPMVFAKKLTFPEPVSHINIEKLRFAVKNGPNVHPGASLVEYEDGKIVKLSADDPARRQEIANTLLTPQASSGHKKISGIKIVHRHLRDGDMLLLNRQPTLHKPSIMAHKARVLPGEKTLRLHYANCKSYNADFDGDEMNAHFPQSYLGQSECRHIVNVNHQYLVPKDGTPLSGLIQDHIIAGTLLTMRGRFFTRADYHQLLYSALSFLPTRLKLLPPAILKPERLWSGKQIVSSLIINLIPEGKDPPTVEGRAKVAAKNWKNSPERTWLAGGTPLEGDRMSESEVIIRSGELLCGVIDKAQVGPTPYSFIHVCYELYGGETSSTLLTSLARLFTHYLQYYSGFSLGIEDIIVNKKADRKRRKILKTSDSQGREAAVKSLEVEDSVDDDELEKKYKDIHFSRDDFGLKMLDNEMKKVTQDLNNKVKDVCIPAGLIKKFPQNSLQLMIESGAKGSSVNAMQISCLLGQIELEGRRMPLMLNGSFLPSFPPYDTSPGAGGFVAGRFLTGITPQEYFFHCMAGREGLIDTAVKTSRSGYLQRCMIKHLEGITVNYDLTVRDSDGTVIQFLYGEDGLDILKLQLLKENRLNFLAENYNVAINKSHVKILQNIADIDLPNLKMQIKEQKKKDEQLKDIKRLSPIELIPRILKGDSKDLKKRLENLECLKAEMGEDFRNHNIKKRIDPVNSVNRPDLVFGSVSENMDQIISDYKEKYSFFKSQKWKPAMYKLSPRKFQNLIYYRATKSLAEPGEPVGLLAAQSIGEPSTQMTLNTFHFAGKGEMNVTLGIPRIREILMTASPNIATPTMDLPLLNKPGIEERAEKLRLKLNPVSLKQVLENIKIKEYLAIHRNLTLNYQNYVIRFNFLEHSEYKGFLNTNPSKILYYVEHVFVKKLVEAIKRKKRQAGSSRLVEVQKETAAAFNKSTADEDADNPPPAQDVKVDEGDSSGGEDEGDGDATAEKSKKSHDQDLEYEDPEDEEMIPESDAESEKEDRDMQIKREITSDEEQRDIMDTSNGNGDTPNGNVDTSNDNVDTSNDNVDTSSGNVDMPNIRRHKKQSVTEKDRGLRINFVKCTHSYISNYDFDTHKERWCEISIQLILDVNKIDMKTLLEEEVSKAFVHAVPHIKEALLVKNPDPKAEFKTMLKTNGVNFLEVFQHVDILDINKTYSNNIHAIAEIYGIEAAAKAIKKEIVNVFKPYGIEVDPRHLSLISDYMTSSGFYRPCNRIGMEGNASPLQQMTFETTKNFLVDSMLMGVEDRLKSPSANIIVGHLYSAGTGCFEVISRSGACK